MKKLFKRYWHILFALYAPLYLLSFAYIEKKVTTQFFALNSPIDDMIPFLDFFIIPYVLWFLYVTVGCVYFFFASQRDFLKFIIFLILGMTAFILICMVFPNGLRDFRPSSLNEKSPFYPLIHWLHSTDTSTNVFPSIHVYNSIAVHTAVCKSTTIKHKFIRYVSLVLCVLICLSTIFLKQHSLIDVIGGCAMAAGFYHLVYKTRFRDFLDKHSWA